MNTQAQSADRTNRGIRAVPVWVWLLAFAGGLIGAFLAEPGDFVGNTIPSILTFLVAGLLVGLIAWGVVMMANRVRR